ncbi:MAG: GGDEF domain-containing protein [Myxococcales bacterium]|nr:GGDEF domain-containing protein [Myxococcales bacterium]
MSSNQPDAKTGAAADGDGANGAGRGAPRGIDPDACLDALASALRVFGRTALELPDKSAKEVSELYERWARHVLLATEPPTGVATGSSDRNWADLNRFVRSHRNQEREAVLTNLENLREAIWVFVECFSRSATADRRGDERIRTRLDSLRAAARSADTNVLREEAAAAVSAVGAALDVRAARYQTQIDQLSSHIDQLSSELMEVRRQGELDSLTGAHSRGSLDEYLARITQLGELMGSHATLYLIDVDHFKWVNDRYGHQTGDEVLRQVVENMGGLLRRRDDFIGRYGGDEFVVVIQVRSPEEARDNGERLLFAVSEVSVPHEGETIRISASIGGSMLRPGDDPKSWIARADEAMYAAKRSGRQRVAFDIDAENGAPEEGQEVPSPVSD